MPWYDGSPLLSHLERLHVASRPQPRRRPVPGPVRRSGRSRTTSSTTAATPGPSRRACSSRATRSWRCRRASSRRSPAIDTADGEVDEAFPPMAVTITLADELDISRGDMLCRPHNMPTVAQDIDAMVCWMDETAPLAKGRKYADQAHDPLGASDGPRARLPDRRQHAPPRRDRRPSSSLNEIGRVQLRVTQPLFVDPYQQNRDDGLVHPGRRGLEPDGRRRDDRAAPRGLIARAGLLDALASPARCPPGGPFRGPILTSVLRLDPIRLDEAIGCLMLTSGTVGDDPSPCVRAEDGWRSQRTSTKRARPMPSVGPRAASLD